jgi:hypothetical protein
VSSWLAVPNALSDLVDRGRPRIVALAPGRDELRLVDLDDPALLTAQVDRATVAYLSGARKVSPVPYLVDDDRLTQWAPTLQHPAASPVQRAYRFLALHEYERQRIVLQTELGPHVSVASYKLREQPDGSAWSWAAWLRDVDDAPNSRSGPRVPRPHRRCRHRVHGQEG